jgi:hypothetical protein
MADLGGAPRWCQATITRDGRPITKADAKEAPEGIGLIAGDAVPTAEHLSAGQVISPCFDLEAARESFKEAIEIADWIVCGLDNILPCRI